MKIISRILDILRESDKDKTKNNVLRDDTRSLRHRYPQYKIGKYTYGKPRIHDWGQGSTLCIGSFTSIAPDVQILLGGEHRLEHITTFPFHILWEKGKGLYDDSGTKGDVVIGSDVWIGMSAIILSGVIIGDGAVIGAGAVIAKDVSPYTVVCGNPQKVIKKRFNDDVVEALLKIGWWEWEDETIERYLPFLLNDDVQAFIVAVTEDQMLKNG